MGNSSSTGGEGRHHPERVHGGHGGRTGWSHSLETPEQRNRMKRGYFPPYVGQPGKPQPHKVLPTLVNSNKILKATQNGAILHGGGTISGRKLSEIEEMRKRSTASCPPTNDSIPGSASGRSTPNLLRAGYILPRGGKSGSSKGSSCRDYDSEPDLRDVGLPPNHQYDENQHFEEGGESPLPNSFTLISESPAKKQIRSRKKSKAPPPPPGDPHNNHNGMMINLMHNQQPYPHQYQLAQNGQRQLLLTPVLPVQLTPNSSGGQKRLNRLFKTKAESKSALSSPALRSTPNSELILSHHQQQQLQMLKQDGVSRGGPMRASLDPNRLMRGERDQNENRLMRGDQNFQNVKNPNQRSLNSSSNNNNLVNVKKGLTSGSSGRIDLESEVESAKKSQRDELPIRKQQDQVQVKSDHLPNPLCSPKGDNNPSKSKLLEQPKAKALPVSRHTPSPSQPQVNSNSKSNLQNWSNSPSAKIPQNAKNSKTISDEWEILNQQGRNRTRSPLNAAKNSKNNADEWEIMNEETNEKKNHFYFGMDMGTFSAKKQQELIRQKQQQQLKSDKLDDGRNSQNSNADLHKEISRRKMLKQMDSNEFKIPNSNNNNTRAELQAEGSSRNSTPTNKQNQNHISNSKIIGQMNMNSGGKITPTAKPQLMNNRSESDSDGLHRRQDSGSFDIQDRKTKTNNKIGIRGSGVIRESSSDLSSSDLDVPLVVTRPTLPQKRPDLPRFSPTAAWRALDSPSRVSISGKSFSSEEGLNNPPNNNNNGERVRRGYTRPSAPPRPSHERSGDSGISAGDAGSPANLNPSPNNIGISNNIQIGGRNSRKRVKGQNEILSADRMMKCWTPQQDLDESSSEFECDNEPILPSSPHSPQVKSTKSGSSTDNGKIVPVLEVSSAGSKFTRRTNLFEGKRAAAVVSDSDSKYYSSPGANYGGGGAYLSSESQQPKRLYTRSNKSETPTKSQQKKRFISPANNYCGQNQNPKARGYLNKYPRGVDANWFLSRSEPNSLHLLGLELEGRERFTTTQEDLNESRRERDAQLLAKVFPSPHNKNIKGNGPRDDLEDEFECELELDDEEEEENSSDQTNKINNNVKLSGGVNGNGRINGLEIGYGPSSMHFIQRNYEEKEAAIKLGPNKSEDEEEEEELMRDDLFDYLDQYEEGEFERDQELTTNPNSNNKDDKGGSSSKSGFSHHIIYLPSYDTRRLQSNSNQSWRRARSVDHLDTSHQNILFKKPNSNQPPKVLKANPHPNPKPMRKTSEPSYLVQREVQVTSQPLREELDDEESKNQLTAEEERRLLNKKKFKFQSTLRVKERKKIEEELTREAKQREDERLREIQAMKKVEEEFKKKRAKEKLEAQAASALANLNPHQIIPPNNNSPHHNKIIELNNNNERRGISSSQGIKLGLSHQTSSSSSGGNTSYGQEVKGYNKKVNMNMMSGKRQEPEGAPASNSICNSNSNGGIDLRKELITASKKRSGNLGQRGHNDEFTTELSEMRQERRQYCDYRRAPRQHSLSPARFGHSSSSDIFPISSRRKGGGGGSNYSGSGLTSKSSAVSTIHPQVVCDIPSKPHPYMINASRLSGSNMNLVSDGDRPSSGLGSGHNLSSPSSVISSDNYRREWAAHRNTPGSSGSVLVGGRASSVISLHSAPGYSSSSNDYFRSSANDLSRLHHQQQSPLHRLNPQRLRREYSTSPPRSTSPGPPRRELSSAESTATESTHPRTLIEERCRSPVRITSRCNRTVISIGSPLSPPSSSSHDNSRSDLFQAQPYNKVKGYRPVSFKPTTASAN